MTKICGTKFQFNTRGIMILSVVAGVFINISQATANINCKIHGPMSESEMGKYTHPSAQVLCTDINCDGCEYNILHYDPPSGFFTNFTFATCTSCNPGYILSSYTDWDSFNTQINQCSNRSIIYPSHYDPDTAPGVTNFMSCVICPGGNYSNGKTEKACTKCPKNTYGGMGGPSSCKTCPTHANCCNGATECSDFTCEDGYTKNGDTCVKNQPECPDNSTLGTDNKCVCDEGYYGTTECESCPDNATCTGGEDFECDAGYYKGESKCTECPTRVDVFTDETQKTKAQYTSVVGTTSKTDCYLPSGTYYNVKGKFTLSNKCDWKEKNQG